MLVQVGQAKEVRREGKAFRPNAALGVSGGVRARQLGQLPYTGGTLSILEVL